MSVINQFMVKIKYDQEVFTGTAAQTVLTLSTISIPDSDINQSTVIVNGSTQPKSAYTVDSATQITLSEGVEAGDIVAVVVIGRI